MNDKSGKSYEAGNKLIASKFYTQSVHCCYRDLREQVGLFVESHPGVVARYDYSDTKDRFLVSYHFDMDVADDDAIWDDIDRLETFFYDRYKDEAPLFCEDDRLFKLSPSAETIRIPNKSSKHSLRIPMVSSLPNAIRHYDK